MLGPQDWSSFSPLRKAWEAGGGAIAWGLVCGVLLAVSSSLYFAGVAVSVVGGIVAGTQHRQVGAALLRSLAGGTLFGLSVLAGFELSGESAPVVALPDPRIQLIVFTVLPSPVLHLVGFRIRRWRERRAATQPPRPPQSAHHAP